MLKTHLQRTGTTRQKTNYRMSKCEIYSAFPHCQKTNHTTNMSWNGSNAAKRPLMYKTENSNHSTDDSQKQKESTQNATTPILKNFSNQNVHDYTGHL